MKKFSLAFLSMLVLVSTFFASISFAATVGQSSPSPDTGWKRFDDTDAMITKFGAWYNHTTDSNRYGGAVTVVTEPGGSIAIKFKGTKVRIIDAYFPGYGKRKINIDGVTEEYNVTGAKQYNVIVYEKTGLPYGEHTVILSNPCGNVTLDAIDIDSDAGELLDSQGLVTQSIDLVTLNALGSNSSVNLTWNAIAGMTEYNIKRSSVQSGPYSVIGSTYDNSFTDTSVVNGETYYYIVSPVVDKSECSNSNETSATPTTPPNPDRALLTIYISGGQIKEYDLSAAELNAFLSWYDAKDAGSGPAKYKFVKTWNKGPFKTRAEYVIFDKILTFDVDEYEVENP